MPLSVYFLDPEFVRYLALEIGIMLMLDKREVSINAILITGRLVIWSMVMAPICPPVKPAIDSGWIKVTVLEVSFAISEVLNALISAEFNVAAMSALLAGKVGLSDEPEVATEVELVIAFFLTRSKPNLTKAKNTPSTKYPNYRQL